MTWPSCGCCGGRRGTGAEGRLPWRREAPAPWTRSMSRCSWSGSRSAEGTTTQLLDDPLSVHSLLPFKHEGDLRSDAVVLDLIVLDRSLEFLDPNGGDPVQGLRSLGDNLPCGGLPAF